MAQIAGAIRSFVSAMFSGFTLALMLSYSLPGEKPGMLDQHGLITFGSFR